MVGAVVTALQEHPEAFYAVGVDLLADVLTDGVFDGLMLEGQAMIARVVVSIDSGRSHCSGHHEALRVALSVSLITLALTRLVFRSLAPTTVALPTVPRPALRFFDPCLLRSGPPI